MKRYSMHQDVNDQRASRWMVYDRLERLASGLVLAEAERLVNHLNTLHERLSYLERT